MDSVTQYAELDAGFTTRVTEDVLLDYVGNRLTYGLVDINSILHPSDLERLIDMNTQDKSLVIGKAKAKLELLQEDPRRNLFFRMTTDIQRAYIRHMFPTVIQFGTKFSRIQGKAYEFCTINYEPPYLPGLLNHNPQPDTLKIFRVVGLHTYFISRDEGKIDRVCKQYNLDLVRQITDDITPMERRELLKPLRSTVIEEAGFYDLPYGHYTSTIKTLERYS